MKNIREITPADLDYIKNNPVIVYEKLDLVYFSVKINTNNIEINNNKRRLLTDVDFIVNSIYEDLNVFVEETIKPKHIEILENFGECIIGFYYLPSAKYNIIEYKNLTPKSFIFGRFYTVDKDKSDLEKIYSMFSESVLNLPIIKVCEKLDININSETIVEDIIGTKTWSGNEIDDIEGIVLTFKNSKRKYCIDVIDTRYNMDKSVIKIYRDIVIDNFIKWFFENRVELTGKTYIDNVCEIFIEYINTTDLLTKTFIEENDLMPPHMGYAGDIVIERIPSYSVRTICEFNGVYKNIFKILLMSFRKEKHNKIPEYEPNKTKINIVIEILNGLYSF